jgi:hypothetical protein
MPKPHGGGASDVRVRGGTGIRGNGFAMMGRFLLGVADSAVTRRVRFLGQGAGVAGVQRLAGAGFGVSNSTLNLMGAISMAHFLLGLRLCDISSW